jgi:hypothetical protein
LEKQSKDDGWRYDANVCVSSTRYAALSAVKYFDWDDAKNAIHRRVSTPSLTSTCAAGS